MYSIQVVSTLTLKWVIMQSYSLAVSKYSIYSRIQNPEHTAVYKLFIHKKLNSGYIAIAKFIADRPNQLSFIQTQIYIFKTIYLLVFCYYLLLVIVALGNIFFQPFKNLCIQTISTAYSLAFLEKEIARSNRLANYEHQIHQLFSNTGRFEGVFA